MISEFDANAFLFLLKSAQWTVMLTLTATLMGGVAGLVIALARVSHKALLRRAATFYIGVIQGVPVLVILFLAFFGVARLGLDLPAFFAAALAMSLFASGYLAEIWRGAIQSVPKPQWEASTSLALTRLQQFRYIIIPQAIRIALPPTVGFLVQLVKNTSIVSILGVVELARAGQILSVATFQPFLVFVATAALYFAICFPLSQISRRLEVKLSGYAKG